MSWLCDYCGYENEFNDESQPTECPCCGEKAPWNKIVMARQELSAYHREEARKEHLERHRRKKERWQQKIGTITKCVVRVTKAVPLVMAVVIVLSCVWGGVSFYEKGVTWSGWSTQMYANIDSLSVRGDSGQLVGNFSRLAEHVKAGGKACVSGCLDTGKTIIEKLLDRNVGIIVESAGDNLKQMGEQIPFCTQNIRKSLSNIKYNWRVFWNRAKGNVQELITTITRR